MRIDLSNLQRITKSDQKKLDTLKQGDVIKARIVDVDGDMVKIDLGNGEMVEAKLDVPLDLTKGKPMSFVVKDLSDGKLTMSPVYEESDLGNEFVLKNKSAIMDRILTLSNLSKDDKNLSIIKNMVSYKMPLKQEDIKAIAKYTDKLISILNLKEGETLETLSNSNPLDIDINKLIKILEGADKSGDAIVSDKNIEVELDNLIIEAEEGTLEESNLEPTKADKNNSFKEASLKFLNNSKNTIAEGTGVKIDGEEVIKLNNSNISSEQLDSAEKSNTGIIKLENIKLENLKLENPIKNIEVKTTTGEKVTISSDSLSEALKTAMESVDTEGTNQKSQPNTLKSLEVITVDGEIKTVDTKALTDALKTLASSSTNKSTPDTSIKNLEITTTQGEKIIISNDSLSEALKTAMESVDTENTSRKGQPNEMKNVEVKTLDGEIKTLDIKALTDVLKINSSSSTSELDELVDSAINKSTPDTTIRNIETTTTQGEKVTISSDSLSESLKSAMESIESESTSQMSHSNELKKVEVTTVGGDIKTVDTKALADALKASVSEVDKVDTSTVSKTNVEENIKNTEVKTSETDFKELSNLIKDSGLKSESESINLKDVLKQLDTEALSKPEFKDVTELIKSELKDSFNGENKATDLIQKLTFLVKSDVDVTLNNLSRLNKFLEQNQTINKDLGEVLEFAVKEGVIDEKSKFELLEKVKTLDLKFDGRDSEKLKDFQGNLKEVSEKLLSTIKSSQNSSEQLNQKASNLNDNIAFLNKINDKNTLMLIPFTVNQKELENSLYVLSKKKVAKSSENIKVYMNLNTSNLESVKILCDYSYDKLNVNFKVKEDFLKLFETRKIELQQILESKGYENTILTVSRQQEEKVLDIISHDDTINYMLNIKV